MQERHVPHQERRGPAQAPGEPRGRGDGAVHAAGAPVGGHHYGIVGPRATEGVHVADGHARRKEQPFARAHAARHEPRRLGLVQAPVLGETLGEAPSHALGRLPPTGQPVGVARGLPDGLSDSLFQRLAEGRHRQPQPLRGPVYGVLPVGVVVHHHVVTGPDRLQVVHEPSRSQPAAQVDHRLDTALPQERLGGEQGVVVGHGVPGPAVQAEPRGHVGKERPAQRRGEIDRGPARRGVGETAGHQDAAGSASRQRRQPVQGLPPGPARRAFVTGVGALPGAPGVQRRKVRPEVLACVRGRQGLAEHAVQVDGAAGRTAATAHRLIHRGQERRGIDACGRTRQGRGPLRIAAEEPDLVHGLVGPGVLELRRTVAAQDQQRHALQRRLHHGRPHVGQGAARGGDHRGRRPRGPGVSQGVEGRAALVVVDDAASLAVARCRHHQRRTAGPGGYAEGVDAVADELFDEQPRPQVVQVGGPGHCGRFRARVKWPIL